MSNAVTWVEVSRAALKANYEALLSAVSENILLMPVIKSNAYGHGLLQVARALPKKRRWGFVVAETDEALLLRRVYPRERILLLSNFAFEDIPDLAAKQIDLAVYTEAQLPQLRRAQHAHIHVKVDTGTTRTGFLPRDLKLVARFLQQHKDIALAGVFSHFADSEGSKSAFTTTQIHRFKKALTELPRPEISHIACSAASLRYSKAHFGAIRPGIALYGLWPSESTKKAASALALKPVLEWKARVLQTKAVPAGTTIGYGRTYAMKRKGKVAVLPIGYGDGFDRALSNTAEVLVRGKRAKVAGRVCMNVTMIDVSHIPGVKTGDEVVLIGKQGKEEVSVEEMAKHAGTINYEITTRIRESLPRIIV
ncbi:MAG: alanine racemase [Patescibacteria group bacterium]|jgi:alanine racemase